MLNLARVQGGQQIQTGKILVYFEDSNLLPNAETGREVPFMDGHY